MIHIFSFGLGVIAAFVIIIIIALVVIAFKLWKRVSVLENSTSSISQDLTNNINDINLCLDAIKKDAIDDSRSYTDARIDKLVEKLEKK